MVIQCLLCRFRHIAKCFLTSLCCRCCSITEIFSWNNNQIVKFIWPIHTSFYFTQENQPAVFAPSITTCELALIWSDTVSRIKLAPSLKLSFKSFCFPYVTQIQKVIKRVLTMNRISTYRLLTFEFEINLKTKEIVFVWIHHYFC